jgi:hypothetical protein
MISRYLIPGLLLYLHSFAAGAVTRIAILDFELKDLTLAPGIPAEIKRTESIKPLLEKELSSAGYELVSIPLAAQRAADSGVGYLFDHNDVASNLGKQFGADYILVGRLITESKGPNLELVIKAVENLADKIDNRLENRYTPPPPGKPGK